MPLLIVPSSIRPEGFVCRDEILNSLKDDIDELEQLSNDGEDFPKAIGNLAYQF